MTSDVLLSEYNIRLLNFAKIYEDVEIDLINDLYKYNLLHTFKVNSDIRKLLMHHLIVHICNTLMSYKGREKTVIYYNIDDILCSEFISDKDKFLHALGKSINKIGNVLPIRIFKDNKGFESISSLCKKSCGDRDEFIAKLRSYCYNLTFDNFTFSKIRNFTQKNDLTFLNKDYFNTLKSKQLLLT